MERTYRFTFSTVHVDLLRPYAFTAFLDGTKIASKVPQVEDRDRAERLGYGGDLGALIREEHVLHTWLAEKLHYIVSPHLWACSHPEDPPLEPEWYREAENTLVAEFQSILNRRLSGVFREFTLTGRGPSLQKLREEAWLLLRTGN